MEKHKTLQKNVAVFLKEDPDFRKLVEAYIKARPAGRKTLVEAAPGLIRTGHWIDNEFRQQRRRSIRSQIHDDHDPD